MKNQSSPSSLTERGRVFSVLITLALLMAACGDGEASLSANVPAEAEGGEANRVTQAGAASTSTTTAVQAGQLHTGDRLPPGSAAVGLSAPTMSGRDLLTGAAIESVPKQGMPVALLFAPLAEWCPHCGEHLELVVGELTSMETSTSIVLITPTENPSPQFPQNEWLRSIGWSHPTLDEPLDYRFGDAYGILSFPTWFMIDSNGLVVDVVDAHDLAVSDLVGMITSLE